MEHPDLDVEFVKSFPPVRFPNFKQNSGNMEHQNICYRTLIKLERGSSQGCSTCFRLFLEAAKSYGVPEHLLFKPDDLVQMAHVYKLVAIFTLHYAFGASLTPPKTEQTGHHSVTLSGWPC